MTYSPVVAQTARLRLDPLMESDVADIMRIYGDPATWLHSPSGRYTSTDDALAMVARSQRSHREHRLGTWAIRTAMAADESLPSGSFIGTGGMLYYEELGVWNLGYRLTPLAWGRGFATELAVAALEHAGRLAPSIPVSARVLTSNPASMAVLEKVNLRLLWQGESPELPVGDSVEPVQRRIYGDRPLPERAMEWFIAHP